MILTAAGKTDRGLVRSKNEDHIHIDARLGLLVVADGMGGHRSGETASRLAVEVVRDFFHQDRQGTGPQDGAYSETTNRLRDAIWLANRTVYETAQKSPGLSGMGTTIAAAVLKGNQVSYAHIGDSRIYLVRSGSIMQLTDDHSLVREQVRHDRMTKEEAAHSTMKNILTRAVGIDSEVAADLGELTVLTGDILLLCSDGLHNMVSDEEMLEIISRAGNVHAASEFLVDTANDNGGLDNVSAIVGYIHKEKWYASWSTFVDTFRR
ncbi:MAG: Stp1/IreP family PP2C-type Ser/Thr phosphatase [Deltaproteobacteria bacterium]|nr:Stp1/IreP family PP2C-type Ser/Thr phosphatase [Deltaproteobacteria bacterium]